jgi:1,2-diacylglycerol 3-alpha-glucosyltransferase
MNGPASERLKVLIACSGIGIMNRGIETFFREAFDGLRGSTRLDIHLAKGRGLRNAKEHPLWCLPRTGNAAALLGRCARRNSYVVEQWSSLPSVALLIRRWRPHVIYYSDANLGFLLYWLRPQINVPYRLLYSNGAPVHPPFVRVDFVHQVAPTYLNEALAYGEPEWRHIFAPYGFSLPTVPPNRTPERIAAARHALGLPINRPIVLTVGWISRRHKRMDYVIEEIGHLREPRPYLVMLGAMDKRSSEIVTLANNILGASHFTAMSVLPDQVPAYYQASDIFVLGSLSEGFGRVYVEALSHGLPVLAHDFEVSRFVLGSQGYFANFATPGALTALLEDRVYLRAVPGDGTERWRTATDRFSWRALAKSYESMFFKAAFRPLPCASI